MPAKHRLPADLDRVEVFSDMIKLLNPVIRLQSQAMLAAWTSDAM
jgi:hypothetical protein